jgi:hypothetical protein
VLQSRSAVQRLPMFVVAVRQVVPVCCLTSDCGVLGSVWRWLSVRLLAVEAREGAAEFLENLARIRALISAPITASSQGKR